ncbi:MAG: efflux RND transporter periplasmic adaptor subunit [Phycisphaerales bacterium]|nr:efflux RND transporter periplasmic adaptor subunit [Phycisphaerales bacterium]
MAQVQPTFSDQWYRVAETCPRLSIHLSILRQVYRGEVWYIVKNPATDQYYRFNPSAYMFLGLLDGEHTVDSAWEACNSQLGDDAPTQRECIELLSKLQLFGLLRGELPLEVDMLKERAHDIRKRHFEQLTGKFVFMTLPLINPERFLQRYENVGKWVFSRWGFVCWLLLFMTGLIRLIPRLGEFGSAFNMILEPRNLIWMTVIFVVLKTIHEFSHAFACKAYGGRVTEMGIMLMLLLPIPYCNATDSWGFTAKAKRVGVAAAGMYGEFAIASVAAIIWSVTEPGVLHTIAFNTIFIASITTLLFNLNPLLRYDGYYMLSDLIEVPNLANRSQEMLKHLINKKVFGVKDLRDPHVKDLNEQTTLVTYSLCSMPYRLLIVTGIIIAVTYRYPAVGVVLAVLGIVMWLLFPIGKGVTYVLTSHTLHQVRPRAILISGGASLAVILLFGVIPWPAHGYATGVVEPVEQATLRTVESGFVEEILVEPGDRVIADQVIVRLRNDERSNALNEALALYNSQRIRLDAAASSSPLDRNVVERQLESARRAFETEQERAARLVIASPTPGMLIAPDLLDLQGAFLQAGAEIARVATLDDLVVKVTVDDQQFGWLFQRDHTPTAAIRIRGRAGTEIDATIERVIEAGHHDLIAPQLSSRAGGEVTMDPTAGENPRTLHPQFVIILRPDADDLSLAAGARVRVQFTSGSEPLMYGWIRRIYQSFLQKFPW